MIEMTKAPVPLSQYMPTADSIVSMRVDWTGYRSLLALRGDAPRPRMHYGSVIAFTPVPCVEGLFTIDRIPAEYWIGGAETSATGNHTGMWVPFDATDTAATDLPS